MLTQEAWLALAATAAMAIACAGLSVVVIARRWAFIGEGISHAGFGGAGVAWIVMILVPSLVNAAWLPYLAIIVFCLTTSIAIGYVSRSNRISADTAIGIFMVASLAFGFLAQQIFRQSMHGLEPPGFAEILFGRFSGISIRYSLATIAVSICVIVTLTALGKEILYFCLDPLAAQASGVPAAFIHYLLMVLLALVVVIGIPITGSVLVTALLVLPGATANLVSQKLPKVVGLALAMTVFSAVAGVALSLGITRIHIPAGPVIVLLLFVIFLVTYAATRLLRPTQQTV